MEIPRFCLRRPLICFGHNYSIYPKFKPLRTGEDSRFCELVLLVRRCYNTLKEIGLPSDMDNSHMLSIIEQKMCVNDWKVWSRELQRDKKPASLKGLIDWMSIEMKSCMCATAPIRTISSNNRFISHLTKTDDGKSDITRHNCWLCKILPTGLINVKRLKL